MRAEKFNISCEIQVLTFYRYLVTVLAKWRPGHDGPQATLEIKFEGANETRSKYEDNETSETQKEKICHYLWNNEWSKKLREITVSTGYSLRMVAEKIAS